MDRNTVQFQGTIDYIGEIVTVKRENKKALSKRTVGVISDDNQRVFFEYRDKLDRNIGVGDAVKVDYYFSGSAKNDKLYNNIIAVGISKN